MKSNRKLYIVLPNCTGLLAHVNAFLQRPVRLRCPECRREDELPMHMLAHVAGEPENWVGNYSTLERPRPEVQVYVCKCRHQGDVREFVKERQD